MARCKNTDMLTSAIKKAGGGKVQTSSDTARKLATEMGGMKKGGKPKSGLAVMIAIGEAKKPVKKMNGGTAGVRDMDMESSKVTRTMKKGGACMGDMPVKKALGGGMDAKLSRSITNAKADMARMAATPRVDPRNIKETPGGGMFGKMMKNPDMRAKLEAAAEKVGVPAQRIGIGYPVRSTPVPKIQYKGSEMPVKRAVGGAGKTRKGMCDTPSKFAKGGAGKVRKGMMSPTGQILQAVKPKMK